MNMRPKSKPGFSLVEMVVVLGVIVMILSLTLTSFPKLRNQIAVTLATRQMALAIRQAQSYAISVRDFNSTFAKTICNSPNPPNPPARYPPYGVHLMTAVPDTFIVFGDITCSSPPAYNSGNVPSEIVSQTYMQNGTKISALTGYVGAVMTNLNRIDIVYQRPTPSVTIVGYPVAGGNFSYNKITITISSADNTINKIITVGASGQVSLQ